MKPRGPQPKEEPEERSKPPQLWIWSYKSVVGGGGITRFFFKEEVNPYPRPNREAFRNAFKEISEVFEVRPYAFYLAVQWKSPENDSDEELGARVIKVGQSFLKQYFGWQAVEVGLIKNMSELSKLRQRELSGDSRWQWVLGIGE